MAVTVIPTSFRCCPSLQSCTLFSPSFVNYYPRHGNCFSVTSLHRHPGKFSRLFPLARGSSIRKMSAVPVRAATVENQEVKWWEKSGGPNMHDIHSTQEFLDALSQAGEKLVIAEFYGTWCGSCRALFPKLCKMAAELPDIVFLKINFDENKPMCKSLNIKVLPYFHFYRGAEGRIESFSCSLAKANEEEEDEPGTYGLEQDQEELPSQFLHPIVTDAGEPVDVPEAKRCYCITQHSSMQPWSSARCW